MPSKPPSLPPLGGNNGDKPKRPSSTRRGYDSTHRKLREAVLAERPVCERCNRAFAHHAHHLRYPARTTADYASLCGPCHSEIHREETS